MNSDDPVHVDAQRALEAGFVVCGSLSTRTKKYHLPTDADTVVPKCRHGTDDGAGIDAEDWSRVPITRSRLQNMSLCRFCDPDASTQGEMPEETTASVLEDMNADELVTDGGQDVHDDARDTDDDSGADANRVVDVDADGLSSEAAEEIAEIIARGVKTDMLLGTSWVADEIARRYMNPETYADDGLHDPSVAENQGLYMLFSLAFNAGVDYERRYPTGERDAWTVPGEIRVTHIDVHADAQAARDTPHPADKAADEVLDELAGEMDPSPHATDPGDVITGVNKMRDRWKAHSPDGPTGDLLDAEERDGLKAGDGAVFNDPVDDETPSGIVAGFVKHGPDAPFVDSLFKAGVGVALWWKVWAYSAVLFGGAYLAHEVYPSMTYGIGVMVGAILMIILNAGDSDE